MQMPFHFLHYCSSECPIDIWEGQNCVSVLSNGGGAAASNGFPPGVCVQLRQTVVLKGMLSGVARLLQK